ncbi:MAG TPA: ankyrin repeat domain-containing protein [Verrucomicrobiae bacterium]|nr:ankyrin repeat domain-containing protein [Verrucomicrobiae bacterium]
MWQLWLVCALIFGFGIFAAKELNPRQKKRAALMDAIRKGDLTNVRCLTDTGMNLNFNYNWQFMRLGSPLVWAFSRNDRLIADFLIERGASTSPKSPGNAALLSSAVHGGNFDLVDLALAAGHDIHFKPDERSKPLASAIHHRAIPMARYLVSKGASIADLQIGDCRWHAMNSETIIFVHELGMEVPQNILTAINNGDWDVRKTAKTSPEIGGVGG